MVAVLKRVALFAGSFDPIHIGHMALANYVVAEDYADELWFMPTPGNPLKKGTLLPYNLRCRMIEELLPADWPGQLCRIEAALPAPHYTVHTLHSLQQLYPTARFYLLIGADNYATWQQWYQYDRIEKLCRLLVYPRKGFSLPAEKTFGSFFFLHKAPLLEVSSTTLREALIAGKDLRMWLPNPKRYSELKQYVAQTQRR